MNVFLPYADLKKSVECLDPKRLGNQVYRECLTLIRGGWHNHPCSKMWKNYKCALAQYAYYGLEELKKRGKFYPHHYKTFVSYVVDYKFVLPPWFGNDLLHSSHRAALLYKDYDWYSKFGWKEKPAKLINNKIPYYWPV